MPANGAAALEATALHYPYKWYVGSRSICSCSFRHLAGGGLGFGEPEDWYPEEPEYIEATLQFIQVVRGLGAQGHAVECIDVWEPVKEKPHPHEQLTVLLDTVSDREFRLFEDYRFVFSGAAPRETG